MLRLCVALGSTAWWQASTAASTPPPFHGFRYEMPLSSPSLLSTVVDLARGHACFGWVQLTITDSLVGEVRCRGSHGTAMQTWIQSTQPNSLVHVYDSTKIRYHFTSFRVLESSRRTCFQSPPHACASLDAATPPQEVAKDEL